MPFEPRHATHCYAAKSVIPHVTTVPCQEQGRAKEVGGLACLLIVGYCDVVRPFIAKHPIEL